MNTQQSPHTDELKHIADSMGISLYQRFSITEASLFLRISVAELRKVLKQGNLNHIELSAKNIEFFGYQLLEFLLSTKAKPIIPKALLSVLLELKRYKVWQDCQEPPCGGWRTRASFQDE